jgi:hypothetical protein
VSLKHPNNKLNNYNQEDKIMTTESNYACCDLDYNRLKRITDVEKPYKLTKVSTMPNRYPLVQRTHNHKYFIPETINGEVAYRVYYGHSWYRDHITEDEYDALSAEVKAQYHVGRDYYGKQEWFKYVKTLNEVGLVYPDNSFEFTAVSSLGQGLRVMLSRGWFKNNTDVVAQVNRGGVVMFNWEGSYYNGNRYNWHPVFKGLRINLPDMSLHHSCKYEVLTKKVIRKESKQLFAKHKEDIQIATLLINAMGKENFVKESIAFDTALAPTSKKEELYKYVDREDITPLDKIIALCILYSNRSKFNFNWVLSEDKGTSSWAYNELDVEALINCAIRNFKEDLLRDNAETAFTTVSHKVGDIYPQTKWGVTVLHNGNITQQYTY